MTILSYEFAAFLAGSLVLFCGLQWLFKGKPHLRRGLLFIISLLYLWLAGGVFSLFWFGITALGIWAGALGIERTRESRPAFGRKLYWGLMAGSFALLAVFRYANFPGYTAEEFCWLTGREFTWEPVQWAAPLAISYYTLILTGYLTDVYRGTVMAEKSCVRFLLFGGFFPQMSVGPIGRYSRLAGSLYDPAAPCWEDLTEGGKRFLWGLMKKLVIAERLAVLVNTAYGDPETYSGLYLVLAAFCFTLQLYTDFGGSVDMAIGLARMFGVRLEENFRQPFFSRSVAEFWRRWHITLGGWCRDYLYIPLGGSREGLARHIRNLFIVWTFTGLWHGGKWTFLIGVGLYHAAVMSFSLLAKPYVSSLYRKTGFDPDRPVWAAFQRVRTFLLVTAGFVLFRSDSLAMSAQIFAGMASGNTELLTAEGLLSLGLGWADLAVLVIALAVLAADSVKKERAWKADAGRGRTEAGNQKPPGNPSAVGAQGAAAQTAVNRTLLVCFGLLFLVMIFGYYGQGYDASSFIYAQF